MTGLRLLLIIFGGVANNVRENLKVSYQTICTELPLMETLFNRRCGMVFCTMFKVSINGSKVTAPTVLLLRRPEAKIKAISNAWIPSTG